MSLADLQSWLACLLMGAFAIGSSLLAAAERQARQARRTHREEED